MMNQREAAVEKLENLFALDENTAVELLWDAIVLFEGYPFQTVKGLKFRYTVKGQEIFVDRKAKSITKSSVMLAYQTICERKRMGRRIDGPKQLGTFGASYLYPVFITLKII